MDSILIIKKVPTKLDCLICEIILNKKDTEFEYWKLISRYPNVFPSNQ